MAKSLVNGGNGLSENISLSKLEENLTFFRKMYDAVRLVDPINKRVMEYNGDKKRETDSICYDYWSKGKICDNCISVRAHLTNKCYLKLEQSGDVIMMVTAMPVENTDRPIIIELLKNATESMMFGTGEYSGGHLMKNVITEISDKIIKDELTGLYNRRYIDERLPADIVRSAMEEVPISVIFMDVDNLKEINDVYGHIYGDKTIVEVTNIIPNYINNDSDWAARYGGDEFVICLNNTTNKQAYKIAEGIRRNIAEMEIQFDNKTIRTTASLGIYTTNEESLTAEEILTLADYKMYEAKQSGKNASVGINIDIPK
ncbi:MAG: hypothetical protein K0R90_1557 [Oscillospiraceae bacterium]|jgi:diguanylate cyclase (GGDEF)-like protein|nr:hypothetical protein [Oscillospiraceae bacterium]